MMIAHNVKPDNTAQKYRNNFKVEKKDNSWRRSPTVVLSFDLNVSLFFYTTLIILRMIKSTLELISNIPCKHSQRNYGNYI